MSRRSPLLKLETAVQAGFSCNYQADMNPYPVILEACGAIVCLAVGYAERFRTSGQFSKETYLFSVILECQPSNSLALW